MAKENLSQEKPKEEVKSFREKLAEAIHKPTEKPRASSDDITDIKAYIKKLNVQLAAHGIIVK